MSDCDRTSRRNAKTKTWLSCSPSLMLTLSAGRRRKRSSLHSKKELWAFSNRTFQLLLSARFHLVYFQVLRSLPVPKTDCTCSKPYLTFIFVRLVFPGEASGWKSRAAEDSCWEGQGAAGQARGTAPRHGQKHTGQVTKVNSHLHKRISSTLELWRRTDIVVNIMEVEAAPSHIMVDVFFPHKSLSFFSFLPVFFFLGKNVCG